MEWRMGWDSNPRWTCTHAGFQDRCLQPLGHPSLLIISMAYLITSTPESCELAPDWHPAARVVLLAHELSDKLLCLIGSILLHIGKRVRIPLERKGDGRVTSTL